MQSRNLAICRTPPAGKGRPPIVGTVLRDGLGEMCLVRRIWSHAENAGNTGGPRTECWIALRNGDSRAVDPPFRPAIVLGRPGDWRAGTLADVPPIWATELTEALLATGDYRPWDLEPGDHVPDWPATIWDRRVILPDDGRYPAEKASVAPSIRSLLDQRKGCPDDQVWAIDAQILNLAPHIKIT